MILNKQTKPAPSEQISPLSSGNEDHGHFMQPLHRTVSTQTDTQVLGDGQENEGEPAAPSGTGWLSQELHNASLKAQLGAATFISGIKPFKCSSEKH